MSGSIAPMLSPAQLVAAAPPTGGGQDMSPLAQAMIGKMNAGGVPQSNPLSGVPLASLMAAFQPGQPGPGTVAGNAPVMGPNGISPSALSAIQANASKFGPGIGAAPGLGETY